MKYNLNFSPKIARCDQGVVYDEKEFTEQPIQISVPGVVELVESFLKAFEEVAIIEQVTPHPVPNEESSKEEDPAQEEQLTEPKPAIKATALRGVAAKAYICKSKELDERALKQFCSDLANYLQVCCSQISPENFISEEIGLCVAGLREVLEIRNYLARYAKSKKKNYQNGYLYIASL